MAATILVREVFKQASVLLQDIAPQFANQPESQMVSFLNEGALFFSSLLPMANSRIDSLKLAPGTLQCIESVPPENVIPGDGVALTAPMQGIQVLRVLCNMGPAGVTAGKAVRVVPLDMKDAINLSWRGVVGTGIDQVCSDPSTPKYFENSPAVQGPTWVRIAANWQPIPVPYSGTPESPQYGATGNSTYKIPLADEYANPLVNWIVARSNARDTEWADGNKATYFSGLVLEFLNGKVAAVTGNNPNLRKLPFAPQPVAQAAK